MIDLNHYKAPMVSIGKRTRWHFLVETGRVENDLPIMRHLCNSHIERVWRRMPVKALSCYHCHKRIRARAIAISIFNDWGESIEDTESMMVLSDQLRESGNDYHADVVITAAANPVWYPHKGRMSPHLGEEVNARLKSMYGVHRNVLKKSS